MDNLLTLGRYIHTYNHNFMHVHVHIDTERNPEKFRIRIGYRYMMPGEFPEEFDMYFIRHRWYSGGQVLECRSKMTPKNGHPRNSKLATRATVKNNPHWGEPQARWTARHTPLGRSGDTKACQKVTKTFENVKTWKQVIRFLLSTSFAAPSYEQLLLMTDHKRRGHGSEV